MLRGVWGMWYVVGGLTVNTFFWHRILLGRREGGGVVLCQYGVMRISLYTTTQIRLPLNRKISWNNLRWIWSSTKSPTSDESDGGVCYHWAHTLNMYRDFSMHVNPIEFPFIPICGSVKSFLLNDKWNIRISESNTKITYALCVFRVAYGVFGCPCLPVNSSCIHLME